MSIPDAAAAAAARAAAEARRRAEEARRRAEEAKKAAAAAAAKAAAAAAAKAAAKKSLSVGEKNVLATKAGTRPSASAVRQAFGKDEVSKGLGAALRKKSLTALNGGAPAPLNIEDIRASKLAAKGGTASGTLPGSADALERRSTFAGQTGSVSGTVPTPPTPEERAAQGARDVQAAYDDSRSAGGNEAAAANAAAQKLRELTSGDDIAYNNALIRSSQPTIDKIADVVGKNAGDDGFTGDTDKRAVKDAIRALSDVATKSGEIGSFLIADRLASKIPNESDLMHVDDGFYEHVDNGGGPQLFAALGARLEAQGKNDAKDELYDRHDKGWLESAWDATGGAVFDAAGDVIGAVGDAAGAVVGFVGDAADGVLNVVGKAGEMAVDVAKGTVELAGDAAEWTTEQVTEAAEYAVKNGLKLAGEALNWVGDHARELAADALDIDGQIAKLNSPGDTVTMAVGGSIGLTAVQGGAEVQMEIKKTEDGYEMTLSGSLSGGVFGGLKLPGFPSAEGEANATGTASATMKFDSLDDVTQAAETIGGIGIAGAVGGPAGALLTGATASDEIRDIVEHFESGSVGLELSAEAKASLGETAGLGFGGSIKGAVTTGVRLEITKGEPPALVLEQGVEASGSLALGAPVEIPSLGGKLNGGSIDGSATISAETRIPLPDNLSLGDVVSDPVGSMKKVGQNVIANATTKLSLGVDVHAGVATEGLPINFGSEGGLEINLSGEAKTKDLVGALATAMSGDLGGALQQLGTKTNLDVSVSSYTKDGFNIEEEVSVPGFSFEVHAQDEIRDETEIWSFEGTPAQLAQKGFNLFEALNLNVS